MTNKKLQLENIIKFTYLLLIFLYFNPTVRGNLASMFIKSILHFYEINIFVKFGCIHLKELIAEERL